MIGRTTSLAIGRPTSLAIGRTPLYRPGGAARGATPPSPKGANNG
jgi:hypothetical protein